MKYISFFFLFLLASGYLQAARVTVTNHDGSVENFNCACSCADVQSYVTQNPSAYRSVSCAERQTSSGNNFAEAACTQSFNEVSIFVPQIEKFPPKPTPTDPGIPADLKDLFIMYEASANKVKVYQVSAQSDWKAVLNGITFTGAKKPYMFFYGKANGGALSINNQKVPVKSGNVSAKHGDILIDGVPIDYDNVANNGNGNGNGGGIPIDTAIFIKWPPKKNNMTTAYFVAGKINGENLDVRGIAAKPIEVKPGGTAKTGMLLINGVPVDTDYKKPGDNGGGGIPIDTAIQIKWPPSKKGTTSAGFVTLNGGGNGYTFTPQSKSVEVEVQAMDGMLLINGVPVETDRQAPGGDPDKPKGCYCVEEPTPGTFTGKDVDCPSGDCVKCCADAKKQGGKGSPVPTEIATAIKKGQYTGDIGGKKYYFGGGDGNVGAQETYPYYVVAFSNDKFLVTNEDVKAFLKVAPKANEPFVVAIGGIKQLPASVKLGKLAETATHQSLPKPLGPGSTSYKNGCFYQNCSVTSSIDEEEIKWEVLCCPGDGDCCSTLVPMGGLDLTKEGMQGGDGENGGGKLDPSTRENVTIFIYKDEKYAVVAGKQTSKEAEETLYGTVKKGAKIDTDEKSAKRAPLPTITTTIPEEPQDPQEARGCRRLGCTTVNCRKCREYQEKLKQGDSRDIYFD